MESDYLLGAIFSRSIWNNEKRWRTIFPLLNWINTIIKQTTSVSSNEGDFLGSHKCFLLNWGISERLKYLAGRLSEGTAITCALWCVEKNPYLVSNLKFQWQPTLLRCKNQDVSGCFLARKRAKECRGWTMHNHTHVETEHYISQALTSSCWWSIPYSRLSIWGAPHPSSRGGGTGSTLPQSHHFSSKDICTRRKDWKRKFQGTVKISSGYLMTNQNLLIHWF